MSRWPPDRAITRSANSASARRSAAHPDEQQRDRRSGAKFIVKHLFLVVSGRPTH
jgi:hypothetical protein